MRGATSLWALCALAGLGTVLAHGPGRHEGREGHEHELFVGTATTLSIISGLAATLGGVIVITIGVPSQRLLGHLLSFSAGVMLYISYADLLVHSASSSSSSNASTLWVSRGLARSARPGGVPRARRR